MPALRIVFMGTAQLACPSLEKLARNPEVEIIGVVTQPDRPKGRALKLQPSPVKELALRLGLPTFQPERLRAESAVKVVADWRPDMIVVAAYGQILPPAVLSLPRWGCLNVHASLLPKYRGAAPIQWALLNDEAETGVTIMQMDAGLDTGGILVQQAMPITLTDDAQSLHDRLAALGAELLLPAIRAVAAGAITARPQLAEQASYARKIIKEDGRLDWSQPARVLWNRIRAFNPWPGAFTVMPAEPTPIMLKIWQAEIAAQDRGLPGEILRANASDLVIACGQEALRIISMQREGKRRLEVASFLIGCGLRPGQKLE